MNGRVKVENNQLEIKDRLFKNIKTGIVYSAWKKGIEELYQYHQYLIDSGIIDYYASFEKPDRDEAIESGSAYYQKNSDEYIEVYDNKENVKERKLKDRRFKHLQTGLIYSAWRKGVESFYRFYEDLLSSGEIPSHTPFLFPDECVAIEQGAYILELDEEYEEITDNEE